MFVRQESLLFNAFTCKCVHVTQYLLFTKSYLIDKYLTDLIAFKYLYVQ